ncbi:MAG: GNAT family N-acetyltransferase [Pyrinomonadaceae bacterium]
MFETERLILRKLKSSDLNEIFAMRKDPLIMRYIRGPQTDLDSSIKWIEMMTEKWDKEKIGFCGVIEKETGNFVGWCGLWNLGGTDDIEVGYAIAKHRWGKGYATEAAARCLEYGFNDLSLPKIVAVAFPENIGSQNVMKKIGMKYIQTGIFYEKELVQFGISAEEYFALHLK